METLIQLFIKKTLLANKKIKSYIQNKLNESDFEDSNLIGAGGDKTKQIDIIAENIFIHYLIDFCDIISEESGLIRSKKQLISNAQIIIDPLDGSDNFLASLPYYGTSVSLHIDNLPMAAIVYNLINNTYYYKTPYKTNLIKNNFLEPNIGIFERAYTRPDIVIKLQQLKLKFRSPGATALSLANTHNYTFFLLAGKMREYDIDAGLYLTNDLYQYQNEHFLLVSKNIKTFENIKEIIKGY
jgi:myo-inositol-1(or 4)-monophosphatase